MHTNQLFIFRKCFRAEMSLGNIFESSGLNFLLFEFQNNQTIESKNYSMILISIDSNRT